jgi:hypothetical protein
MNSGRKDQSIIQDPKLRVLARSAVRRYFSSPSWAGVPDTVSSGLVYFIGGQDIRLPYDIFLAGLGILRKIAREDRKGDPNMFSNSFLTRTARAIYSAPGTFEPKQRPISLEVRAYDLGGVFALTDQLRWPRK